VILNTEYINVCILLMLNYMCFKQLINLLCIFVFVLFVFDCILSTRLTVNVLVRVFFCI